MTDSDGVVDMDTHVDSDWAGCQKTRRSTSGFIIFLLGCVIRVGSRTQLVPAWSSAEAELYGIGTGVAESLHIKSFLEEAKLSRRFGSQFTPTLLLESQWRADSELQRERDTFSFVLFLYSILSEQPHQSSQD